jgi:hypothetical protein
MENCSKVLKPVAGGVEAHPGGAARSSTSNLPRKSHQTFQPILQQTPDMRAAFAGGTPSVARESRSHSETPTYFGRFFTLTPAQTTTGLKRGDAGHKQSIPPTSQKHGYRAILSRVVLKATSQA